MLSIKLFLIYAILLVSPLATTEVFGLLQEAGSISVDITPGQTQQFTWGLQSDVDKTITIQISAEGDGSQYLVFSSSMQIEPHEVVFVTVDVMIPHEYDGDLILSPTLVATEMGDVDSSTIINVQMAKTITLLISEIKDNKVILIEESQTSSESKNEEQMQGNVVITEQEAEILSPLKQVKNGISSMDIVCKESLNLLLKPSDNSPVCVTADTYQKLISRDWMMP